MGDNVLQFYGFELSSTSSSSPELTSSQTCFKYTLLVANLIFLIFGCVLCGVAGYAMQTKAGGLSGVTLPTGIIVIGVFIILASLLGFFSAFKESRFFLALYFVLLMLFVFILMCVGIAVYVKKDSAAVYIKEGWINAPDGLKQDLQTYFYCCGLETFDDSYASHPCPTQLLLGGVGCLDQLVETFQNAYVAAGACAIAFAVIMGTGMIIVCVLMSGIKQKKHLEDIRKLHRKLREAKEEPSGGGVHLNAQGRYEDLSTTANIDDVHIDNMGAADQYYENDEGTQEGEQDNQNENDTNDQEHKETHSGDEEAQ